MAIVTSAEWDAFLTNRPHAHLMQTTAWGDLKSAFGWQVTRLVTQLPKGAVGAQLLFLRLYPGLTLAYLPKGPVGDMPGQIDLLEPLLPELDNLCRQRRAAFLKVEPDQLLDPVLLFELKPPTGFRPSQHAIQPPRTILVDLCGNEEQVLGRMKQKTRYNIRLALKKGVIVQPSADLELFYRLLEATGQRDQFGIHSVDYYRRAYELFHPRGEGELLVAEFEGELLAALMVFAHGERAWYFYGASASQRRDLMPTYLIQWEAMRWARARGCTQYDLWGIPDVDEQVLESQFTERTDGLWGVYRFKRGFGGRLRRGAGPWDRVYRNSLYKLYLWWVGKGLKGRG